jgi:parallel beta-helix repeat protein
MFIGRSLTNFFLTTTTALIIALPTAKSIALNRVQVEAIAWQVSVLISPNLTAQEDQLLIEGTKTGSGVIIGRESMGDRYTYYVLTALHVVAKRGGVHAIAMPDGAVYYIDANPTSNQMIPLGQFTGELGQTIAGWDLAMLKFVSDRDYAVAPIATTPPTQGEEIFINGWPNPENLAKTNRNRWLTSGHLQEIVNPPQADGGYSLLYTNETESGMSGGPIFNSQGALIGIHGRGRGIENRCSSPEMNLNHSCGMPIFKWVQEIKAQGMQIPLNQNPVNPQMIQYGLNYRSQSDRIIGNQWPLTVLGAIGPIRPISPPVNGNPSPSVTVETNSEPNNNDASVNRPEISSESTANQSSSVSPLSPPIYYINPQTGNNRATAGKTPDTPFQSISYLLQSSLPPGTMIHLAPGVYNSSQETFPLKLPTGVILRGHPLEPGDDSQPVREVLIVGGDFTLTRGWGQQNVTIVAGANSQISGITVSNPLKNGTGIWVETGSPTILNNTLEKNNREGIFIGRNANPRIENNRFVDNVGNGMSITDEATGEIQDNLFENNQLGVAIAGNAAPTVTANQVRNHRIGIIFSENAQPNLQGNTIENNREYGLLILSVNPAEVASNNQIINHKISNQLIPQSHEWGLPLPPELSSSLVFGCLEYDGGLATWVHNGVHNGNATIPQPIILWPSELLQPSNRCESVAGKLNGIAAKLENPLENLFLKTGRVNNDQVVCGVSDWRSNCQRDNMLFPLPVNQGWIAPTELLQKLVIFPIAAPGNPVQQLGQEAIAPLRLLTDSLQPIPGLWFVKE